VPQNTSAGARPGRIIFIGVVIIVLALTVVVLIPLPSIERELNGLIPPGAVEQQRSPGQAMIAVSLTTTQSLGGVLAFYAKKLDLSRQLSGSSGLTIMTRGRLFGGHHSDAIMPWSGGAGEAITITHRESRHVAFISASRGTNEARTHLTILVERFPDPERRPFFVPTNSALAWPLPDAKMVSSGMGYKIAVAEFSTDASFDDVARHYATNLLLLPANQPVPKELRLGDTGLILRQRRDQAQSVLLTKPREARQSFYVFCFRDNAATKHKSA
jgi:hypothetical protein